ncbi:MAG: DUF4245 domain-containing protein [Frankiaceae bacterium]|nr:DUF4245 domain-containing protein [Frankiaceae bacterium]
MAKKQRGRESAGDMVRSLGLVLLMVGAVFFFARAPSSDEKSIRVVDSTDAIQAFATAVPGSVVPRDLPRGWRTTVSEYDARSGLLRVGWVTPKGEYAEYAAASKPTETFLTDITAGAPRAGTVDIEGSAWTEYRQDKAISLVRSYGATTVVLGTLRDTADLAELRVLAGRLAP